VLVAGGDLSGTYDFTNVHYGDAVSGYTAAHDSSTGLEAITFVACFLRRHADYHRARCRSAAVDRERL